MPLSKNFMVAEYNAMYSLVKLHQDGVVGFFRIYLAILVVPFTALAVIKKDSESPIVWDKLSALGLAVVVFILICGVIIFRVCVEHQLKTILYVRCINGIRKFFATGATEADRKAYLLLPTSTTVPPFFKPGRDFFWEASLMAFLNAALASLVAVNLFQDKWAGFAVLGVTGFLELWWYYRLAERLEEKYKVERNA